MKKLTILLCAAIFSLPMMASAAQNTTIAFVNGMQILKKFNPDIEKKLEKQFNKRKNEIVSLQNNIKESVKKLQKDEAILSPAQARDLKRDLEGKQLDYKRLTAAFQEDYTIARNKELQTLSDKIEKIISQVAKRKKVDVVLQSQAAVFVDKKLDITKDVLAELK